MELANVTSERKGDKRRQEMIFIVRYLVGRDAWAERDGTDWVQILEFFALLVNVIIIFLHTYISMPCKAQPYSPTFTHHRRELFVNYLHLRSSLLINKQHIFIG